MITKEEFMSFISEYQAFDEAVENIGEALSGSKYSHGLFESGWYNSVAKMLDTFVTSHFTEGGVDWIYYYMFEAIDDKLVIITEPADIFNEKREIEYHLNSLDELWNFLITDKEGYFKNV